MSENNEQNILANVRLCDAIKWHPCLYDSTSKVYQLKPAVDAAWQSIANECEDTVANSKLRWRIIRKSFLRSFRKNIPNNKYYLNDYLEFLKPHLPSLESNEAKASKAEDYDIIRLNEDRDKAAGDMEDGKDNKETCSHENEKENNHKADEENNASRDEEIEEYTLPDINMEDANEASDTSSAEETVKTTRRGRPRKQQSNTSTPDMEFLNEDESQKSNAGAESARAVRRLGRTRKANVRYMEFDVGDKKYKKESKAEEKRKGEKRQLECKQEKTEPIHLEKRHRRSIDHRRSIENRRSSTPMIREEIDRNKLVPKKLEVKVAKSKIIELPKVEAKVSKVETKEVTAEPKTGLKSIGTSLMEIPEIVTPKITESPTIAVTKELMEKETQYEPDEARTVDDDFLDSLKPQIALMNTRQKFNFKKKIFQSLMEVFDDPSNFANKNELPEMLPIKIPRLDNATSAELLLMRELVSLVTAAKATPEILKCSEKLDPPDEDDANDNATISLTEKSSPEHGSKALSLAASTSSSSGTETKGETLALARHILQKVVKVAGTNCGTILAHEGEKRRVYRIYPKGSVPPTAPSTLTGGSTSSASIGTFYVTPPKNQMANSSQINTMVRTSTHVGNTANGKPITFTTITKSGTIQTNNQSPSTIVPTNIINKSSANGSNAAGNSQMVISRQRVSFKPQLTQRSFSVNTNNSNTKTKTSPLQNKVITSTNATAISSSQEKASPSTTYAIRRVSASPLEGGSSKKGLSQIQISKPISLNTAAAVAAAAPTPRENNIRAFFRSAQESADSHDGNSGDSILPDNPTADREADKNSDDNGLLVRVNIKDEPLD